MLSSLTPVPSPNGRSYHQWANCITMYLHTQGLWQVTDRKHLRTGYVDTAKPTSDEVEAVCDWDILDDKALGSITLCMDPSMQSLLKVMAYVMWVEIKNKFSTLKLVAIFVDFQKVMSICLSGTQEPSIEMQQLNLLFECLTGLKVDLPSYLRVMILLIAFPPKWEGVVASYLASHDKVSNVTFQDVMDIAKEEYSCCLLNKDSRSSSSAQKTNAVKYKDNNLKWLKSKDSSSQNSKKKILCSKAKAKAKDMDHSHLAIALAVIPVLPMSLPPIIIPLHPQMPPNCSGIRYLVLCKEICVLCMHENLKAIQLIAEDNPNTPDK